MSAVARATDTTGGGGIILTPTANTNVYANGKLIAVVGTMVSGHDLPPHDAPTLIMGSGTVKINGIAVCRVGDAVSCAHTISSGSPNVNVG